MRPTTLVVIDPSIERPEREGTRHAASDWPGAVRVLRPALDPHGRLVPEMLDDAAGVIVLGSAASVHDDRCWLRELAELIAPVVRGERVLPLLGVCFGHQLIAHLAGAPVGFLHPSRTKCLGVRRTALTGSRLLPRRRLLTVLASHREVVTAPPPGFTVTGRRREAPVDVIEHPGRPVFGVQFHPEAGDEFLRGVGLDPRTVSPRVRRNGERLLAAFRELALAHAGVPG